MHPSRNPMDTYIDITLTTPIEVDSMSIWPVRGGTRTSQSPVRLPRSFAELRAVETLKGRRFLAPNGALFRETHSDDGGDSDDLDETEIYDEDADPGNAEGDGEHSDWEVSDEEDEEQGHEEKKGKDGEKEEDTDDESDDSSRQRRAGLERPPARHAFREEEDAIQDEDDEDDGAEPRGRTRQRDMEDLHQSPTPEARSLSPGQMRIRQEGQIKFAEFEMMKLQLRRAQDSLKKKQAMLEYEKHARRQDRKESQKLCHKLRQEFLSARTALETQVAEYRALSYGQALIDARGRRSTVSEAAVERYKADVEYCYTRMKRLEEERTGLIHEARNAKDALLAEIMPTMIDPLHEKIIDAQMAAEDFEAKYKEEAAKVDNLERNVEAFELAKRQFQSQIQELHEEIASRADRATKDSTQPRMKQLEDENRTSIGEVQRLRHTIDGYKANITALLGAMKTAVEKETKLEDTIKVLREEMAALGQQQARVEYQWHSQLNESQKEAKRLTNSLKQAQDHHSQTEAANKQREDAMTKSIEGLRSKIEEEQACSADRMSSFSKEVEQLTSNLAATQADRQHLSTTLRKQITDLQRHIEDLEKDLQEEQRHNAGLVEQSKQDHGKIMASLHEQINALRAELKATQRRGQELEQNAQQAEEVHDDLVSKLKAQINTLTTASSVVKEAEKKSAEAAATARNNVAKLEQFVEDRHAEFERMRSEFTTLQNLSSSMQENAENVERSHRSTITDLGRKIEYLKEQIARSARSPGQQDDNRADLNVRIEKLESRLLQERNYTAYLTKQIDRLRQEMSDVVAAVGSGPASLYDALQENLRQAEQSLATSQQVERTTQDLLSQSFSEVSDNKRELLDELTAQLQQRDSELVSRKLEIAQLQKDIKSLKRRLSISENSLNTLQPPKVREFLEEKLQQCEEGLARALKRNADAERKLRAFGDGAPSAVQDDAVARDLLMEKKLSDNLQKENDELKVTCMELTRKLHAEPEEAEMASAAQSPSMSSLAGPSRGLDIFSLMGAPLSASSPMPTLPSASGISPSGPTNPTISLPANDPRNARKGGARSSNSSVSGLRSSSLESSRLGESQSMKAMPSLRASTLLSIPSAERSRGSQNQITSMMKDIVKLRKELFEAAPAPAPCSNCSSRREKVSELRKALKAERNVNQRLHEAILQHGADNDEIQRLEESLRESAQNLDDLVAQLDLSSDEKMEDTRHQQGVAGAFSRAPTFLRAREIKYRGKIDRIEYDLNQERASVRQLLLDLQKSRGQVESLVEAFGRSQPGQSSPGIFGMIKKSLMSGMPSVGEADQCENCARLGQGIYQLELSYDRTKGTFFISRKGLELAQVTSSQTRVFAGSLWSFCIIAGYELRLEWQYLSRTGLLRLLILLYLLGLALLYGIEMFIAAALITVITLVVVLILLAIFYPFGDLFHLPSTTSSVDVAPTVPESSSGAREDFESVPTKQAPSPVSEARTYETHSSWSGFFRKTPSAETNTQKRSSTDSSEVWQESFRATQAEQAVTRVEMDIHALEGAYNNLCQTHIKSMESCHQLHTAVETANLVRQTLDSSSASQQAHAQAHIALENQIKSFLIKASTAIQLWQHFTPWHQPNNHRHTVHDPIFPDPHATAAFTQRCALSSRLGRAYDTTLHQHSRLMVRFEGLIKAASQRRDERWTLALERFCAGLGTMLDGSRRWQDELVVVDGRYSVARDVDGDDDDAGGEDRGREHDGNGNGSGNGNGN